MFEVTMKYLKLIISNKLPRLLTYLFPYAKKKLALEWTNVPDWSS